ncbi:FadR family transcriptional regulator [Amycolatopsis sp. K13G38]|uniref:FadR family transcriptional regulator n=1 Tax=Amycolatopsis acididurans TaxID=2724524 RepID=A0ABX1IWL1_9PSEU|nr:FCD domain-containing protein [Amycolatopsis acididurans]NKQ51878.1 FadR family transcriptional regulator [Amycolatopsis acididurans]
MTEDGRRSRASWLAESVQDEVLARALPTGSRIGLRTELIDRFAVSPSVMNEALHILRERGLVEVRPGVNGGVFVAAQPAQVRLGALDVWFAPAVADPAELFEARVRLDELFAGVALERATPEDVRAMEWALHDMAAAREDARGYLEATMRFHHTIARASRIPVLAGMYESILALLRGAITRAAYTSGHAELVGHALEAHGNLLVAIREQDRAALREFLAVHRENVDRTPC